MKISTGCNAFVPQFQREIFESGLYEDKNDACDLTPVVFGDREDYERREAQENEMNAANNSSMQQRPAVLSPLRNSGGFGTDYISVTLPPPRRVVTDREYQMDDSVLREPSPTRTRNTIVAPVSVMRIGKLPLSSMKL